MTNISGELSGAAEVPPTSSSIFDQLTEAERQLAIMREAAGLHIGGVDYDVISGLEVHTARLRNNFIDAVVDTVLADQVSSAAEVEEAPRIITRGEFVEYCRAAKSGVGQTIVQGSWSALYRYARFGEDSGIKAFESPDEKDHLNVSFDAASVVNGLRQLAQSPDFAKRPRQGLGDTKLALIAGFLVAEGLATPEDFMRPRAKGSIGPDRSPE